MCLVNAEKNIPCGTFSARLVSDDIRSEAMDRTSKYLALALVLIVLAVILVFAQRDSRRPKTGFNVQVAANTCACSADAPRIVVLHIYSREGLAINSESVPHCQLAGRLREIYGTRAERVLYLFPENDIPSQRIAEVIDVVKHLQSEKIKGLPVPRELRTAPENMNIQIRLVTLGALSAPCPKGCFNWGTQGLPVSPAPAQARRESSIEKQVAVLIEKTLNEKTERQEFSDLEALGCPAVP